MEKRFALGAPTATGNKLVGLAVPYNATVSHAGGEERIAPGALAETITDGHDILALIDHDPTRVLARTSNETLRLRETARGLEYEIELPNTPSAAEVRGLAEAGTLGGVSIGFRAISESRDSGVRVIERLELVEVSVVASFPAYPQTSADLRNATPRLNRARRLERLL